MDGRHNMMRSLLGVLFLFFLGAFVLITLGVVTGSLLRMAFPSVDFGLSILIGVVTSVSVIHFVSNLAAKLRPVTLQGDEDEQEIDDEAEEEAEPTPSRQPSWVPVPRDRSTRRRRWKRE
jgi:hypothetical protein